MLANIMPRSLPQPSDNTLANQLLSDWQNYGLGAKDSYIELENWHNYAISVNYW